MDKTKPQVVITLTQEPTGQLVIRLDDLEIALRSAGPPEQSGIPAAPCPLCMDTNYIEDNLPCPNTHPEPKPVKLHQSSSPKARYLIRNLLTRIADSESWIGAIERKLKTPQPKLKRELANEVPEAIVPLPTTNRPNSPERHATPYGPDAATCANCHKAKGQIDLMGLCRSCWLNKRGNTYR